MSSSPNRTPRVASASSLGQQRSPRANAVVINPRLVQDLKNRLYDKGINAIPLPSVKRPRLHNIPIRQTVSKEPQRAVSLERAAPSPTLEGPRPTANTARPSITGFVNAGALRPSSARKKIGDPNIIASQPIRTLPQQRPLTAQTAVGSSRMKSATPEINSRSGNSLPKAIPRPYSSSTYTARRQTAISPLSLPTKDIPNRQFSDPQDVSVIQTRVDQSKDTLADLSNEEWSDLDKFIHLIQENRTDQAEFVYLSPASAGDPYELAVVPANGISQEKYLTISAKGVSTFLNGSPYEFVPLSDWLIEREAYYQLKEIPFFNRFRLWKVCTMWKRNVNHLRREKKKQKLVEKLYHVDPNYAPLLLNHKAMCCEIEKYKFVEIPGHMDGLTLEGLLEYQRKRREEVSKRLEEYAGKLWDNVNVNIGIIMDKLREGIVSSIALDEQHRRISSSQPVFPSRRRTNTALYDKLGFPENMNFGHRAMLRNQCSRYLRFSYLADFYVMESLRNVYISSIRELVSKLRELTGMTEESESKNKRQSKQPLILVNLELERLEIPEDQVKVVDVQAFLDGMSKPLEFDLASHLELLDEQQKGDASPMKGQNKSLDVDQERKVMRVVPTLYKLWLHMNPERHEVYSSLMEVVSEGLDSLQIIERWSRHPKLGEFAGALDEWDDKVAESWDPPESLFLDPKLWLMEEPEYVEISETISTLVTSAYGKADALMEQFQVYLHHYWKDKMVDFTTLVSPKLKGQIEAFTNVCALFHAQKELFDTIPKVSNTGLLKIDSSAARTKLVKLPSKLLSRVHVILPALLRQRCDETKEWATSSYRALNGRVSSVKEFVIQKAALEKTIAVMQDVRSQIDTYGALYNLCTKLEIPVKKEDRENFQEAINLYNSLTSVIILVESNMERNIANFRKEINGMIPDLLEDTKSLEIKISDEKYFRLETQTVQAISELDEYSAKCAEFEERASNINEYQVVLGVDIFRFEVVDELRDQINLRNRLWKSLKEWRELQKKWISSPFSQIDVRFISDKADEFAKVVTRSENGLPDNPVTRDLKDLVFKFRETMPVVIAMRSPLEPSHWVMIKEIIGQEFEINDEFTLKHLMDMNVVDKQEQIQAIQIQAAQEANLKTQLAAVKQVWETEEIEVQVYKDHKELYILGDIEDMLAALDESCATLSTIAGNRYVAVIREDVNKWKEWLNIMQDIMEEWIICQKNWMYLENIFISSDIKRQLLTESQMFDQVDKFYKNLMKKISGSPNALKNTGQNPELLHHFRRYNQTLDQVLKQLSQYLSGKRKLFPRFYFLSDDELLHILAQAQDPLQIQPHLKKCFDNIYRLEFSTERTNEVIAMESAEKESVKFEKSVRAKGNVEEWLNNVQIAMFDSLKGLMKVGRNEYDSATRKEWVLKHPGQVIATIAQVMWTYESEEAVKGQGESPQALDDWYQTNLSQLDQLTELVRGVLTDLERKIIVALITTDVHNRDIVSDLKKNEVANVNEFLWQQQLRYYWDFDTEVVIARQVTAQLQYGYEYMGATSRLVITPLTDRCWITITSALHIKLGAAPAGPAGTGKTESTKDLAKALGTQCVVFNCSEQITYKMMGRLFSGLAQQGAWSCLDEFNRIDIEVLSVIAQQMLTIRRALLQGLTEFKFEDDLIALKPTCGVFVTMNPGYAGRTELPDNLKVCFRPVSMMIPDYALIAEIMLFAEGFSNAKALSKKMVQLYKLSSEQLSRQDHYDFGMRAVKSVLVMAGELKRAEPTISEDAVLIRAMIDSNVPKFVQEDLPLFNALVQDLFPGVEIKTVDYGKFQQQIHSSLSDLELQRVPEFTTKVIQLFDTFNVRFGVMIVGPTGSGKTTCYKVLQHAMTEMHTTEASPDRRFQKVDSMCLNPKCVSMGELYGEVNALTQDWRDGLASTIMRAAAEDTTDDKKWVVFDGPVDALWIENMNTVLDDNMMLCLANGERIKLRPQMRILFEVQDLAVASPATVSRCGMVYISPQIIGWKPYLKSWIQRFFPDGQILTDEMKIHLVELFEQSVEAILKLKKSALAEAIPTVPVQMIKNVCNFLEVLLDPTSGYKPADPLDKRMKYLTYSFVFAYIWGMGGALKTASQEKFSDTVRHLFAKNVIIPISETVFEYFIDTHRSEMSFRHWNENLTDFKYEKSLSYFQMLVPTVDTVRYEALLRLLYEKNKPAFFTGETGVGKSVVVSALITKLKEEGEIEPVLMNFSAQSSSLRTQQTIESKLERRKGKVLYEAVGGKKLIMFVDDVNMPAVEKFGAQPPIELLRQYLDFGGFFDRQKFIFKEIWNSMLICAAAPPGGGRNELTPRFVRHFHVFNLPDPSRNTLIRIFGSLLSGFLAAGNFQEAVRKAVEPAVFSTIEVYQRITLTLKPTPARFHYLFNLRDVSKVFQGLLMTSPFSIASAEQLARCWAHESCRVFHDRLINDTDKRWFTEMLVELITRWFKVSVNHAEMFEQQPMIWSDITNLEKANPTYMELPDRKKLVTFLGSKLEEFNTSPTSKMNIVFFEEAVMHIMRITRTLRQPRGNILLIGVGGSGKQSLTKLVTYILEYKLYGIELSKNYGMEQFREDLKKMMEIAGVQGKNLTFLLTDTQISNEGFLEDINNVLNTGEITNLFTPDEVDKIIEDLRPEVVDRMKLPDSKDIIYTTFVQRVRDRLHTVLCMSPVGDLLRIRCRMFPSLVNCSTIDWFGKWPKEALLSVSKQFLKEIKATEDLKASLSAMCMEMHSSVEDAGDRMFAELRRKTYTTPKSYLDLIYLYMNQLEIKRGESSKARVRLENGLSKLRKTRETVRELKERLKEMAPELEVQKRKTEEYFVEMQRETQSTEVIKESVARENDIIEAQMIECKAKNDDAERDLAEAMPALNEAMRALAALDRKDITVIKSFPAPPEAVRMVMEAVCILLEEKPDWPSAKVLLSQMDFIERLQTYRKDEIPDNVLRKLKNYINRDEFEPEFVGSKALAAKSLCMWCIAMNKYSDIIKVVRPKREKVKAMNAKLEADVARLKEKQDELLEVEEKVNKLRQECDDTQEKVAQLEQDIRTTQLRLERAEQLIDLLADEGVRWEFTLEDLTKSSEKILGNVFLSAASISYLGPFTGSYRTELTTLWTSRCIQLGIPCADDFSLEKVMGKPVEIREWNIAGLPTDKVSIENGILATTSQRWPLMIDPQMQGHSWIKAMERDNELKLMRLLKPTGKDEAKSDEKSVKESKEMMRLLEACISNGKPLLLEDVGEQLDPSIDPVLRKNVFKTQDGRSMLRLGDQDVNYDSHFRLYVTSKLPNPHYLPEICIKVNVINFTVTFAGLEEQLLGDVVKQEKPVVEQQKNELIVSMANDKKMLEMTQNKILQLIAESSGNILDDVVLIETMQTSKATSRTISKRVEDSVVVEMTINKTRDEYKDVSVRGSILYFVVSDLAGVDPMYQYSLAYIKRIFNMSIEGSPQRENVQERCSILISSITRNIYTNVCRGLFESHKAIFSFLIASSINRNSGLISQEAWNFLLRGSGIVDKTKQMKNPDPTVFGSSGWDLATMVEVQLGTFSGLTAHFAENIEVWREYASNPDIIQASRPDDWDTRLDDFSKLLLFKIIRPEKLMFAFGSYVQSALGSFFTESPPVTMDTLYQDSEAQIPIIFVLSQGADPTNSLLKYSRDKGYFEKTEIISLGQGQGPKAQECLERAKTSGNWVVLQNCHLAKSWMPALEKIVEGFREEKHINPAFRLFLTSMPADYFPVSVLQNGLKQTTEPPRGIRSNLKRSYGELTEEQIVDCSKPEQWRKLLFGLCFFHSVVQERRKFGPLGFNIRYEFNDSDLETSITNLKMFLDDQEEIPWDAMLYLTGHINYGGRVTDDWDRKCLLSILKRYYTAEILEDGYLFSESGLYYALKDSSLTQYREYIDGLPLADSPEIFGMHQNANISYQTQESEKIISTILSVQPRITTGTGGKSNDEIVQDLATGLTSSLPEKLDQSTGHSDLFIPGEYGLIPSLSTVLLQEVERFNRLLTVMQRTLLDLQKAIKGEVVMSQDLDDMYFAVLNALVPPNWKKVAYPSLKPLPSWIRDLNERVEFMRNWLTYGNPACYWLSGFYFPQAFITGTLQTFSRRYQLPIDHISFSFNVLDHFKEEDGVYVYGLFLEGARWDMDEKLVMEQEPGELFCPMPVIHFLPAADYESSPEDYQCPVYKTSVRAGELSTTGQSTNFILAVDLQTEESPDSWTLKGTALLCQLNE